MQILRQALLQKLPTPIMQLSVVRNKILCLTQYQLILLSIDSICKKVQIPYIGSNVRTISMSKDYIAILQRTGSLQIRKVENIKQVIVKKNNIKIANSKYPRLKWWEDDLHLVYQHKWDQLNVTRKEVRNCVLPFCLGKSQQLRQMQFTDLFMENKGTFFILKQQIHLCINSLHVGMITLPSNEQIKQVLRLCHPLQQNQFKKQYLVVLTQGCYVEQKGNKGKNVFSKNKSFLKVYNILTMSIIFQKQLFTSQQDFFLEMITDQLSQYLLIKHYKRTSSPNPQPIIQSQQLLKVNSQYYYSDEVDYNEDMQPFFLFQIQIGLRKDLRLFPSHVQEIKGKLCNSIDTCYYQKSQVYIASIVLQVGYRDGVYKMWGGGDVLVKGDQGQMSLNNNNSVMIWRQIIQAKLNPTKFIHKLIKKATLNTKHSHQKHPNNKQPSSSIFSAQLTLQHQKLLHHLLLNLNKLNNFTQPQLDSAYQTMRKILAIEYSPMLTDVMSIEREESNSRQREILEKSNQDYANTMSGCSSSLPQSPRSQRSRGSAHSEQENLVKQQKMILLKDFEGNTLQTPQELLANIQDQVYEQNPCIDCLQLQMQDHQNLQLTLSIINHSSNQSQQSLLQIQQTLTKMQQLVKYRLQKIQMKTRQQKKQSLNIVSTLQKQFQNSLNQISSRLLLSADKFIQKINGRPSASLEVVLEKQQNYLQTVEDTRLLHENQLKLHKDNHQQLLDYLYDIEFPEIGFETYNATPSHPAQSYPGCSGMEKQMKHGYSNLVANERSSNLGKDINIIQCEKQYNQQQFKLFSQMFLKTQI